MFSRRQCRSIAEIQDGTSNTIAMSERLKTSYGVRSAGAQEVPYVQGIVNGLGGLQQTPNLCYTTTDGRYFLAGQSIKGTFGSLWHDGQPERVAFNTVLPPNAPACAEDANQWADSRYLVIPPTSNHPGGADGLLADGSVRFISETIDNNGAAVYQPATGLSRYGVWGAIGSIAGGESVSVP
jgi:hypothetical protein